MTAEDNRETFYWYEMAVAKAPGMFRPFKGKPTKTTTMQPPEPFDVNIPETRKWDKFAAGFITGAVIMLLVRRITWKRS